MPAGQEQMDSQTLSLAVWGCKGKAWGNMLHEFVFSISPSAYIKAMTLKARRDPHPFALSYAGWPP